MTTSSPRPMNISLARDRDRDRKHALMAQGLGISRDSRTATDPNDYVVIIVDLCPIHTELSTLGGVIGKAHAELLARHRDNDWANPVGEPLEDDIRLRLFVETRAQTAAQVYGDLMQLMFDFVMMEDTERRVFGETIWPGSTLDVVITVENGGTEVEIFLDGDE